VLGSSENGDEANVYAVSISELSSSGNLFCFQLFLSMLTGMTRLFEDYGARRATEELIRYAREDLVVN